MFGQQAGAIFFRRILTELNSAQEEIRAFLFTGLASANITDFYFCYKDADGVYHSYFPDFILLKNSGEFYVVEIKAAKEKDDPTVKAKAKAVEELAGLSENSFRYAVIYADDSEISTQTAEFRQITKWIRDENG